MKRKKKNIVITNTGIIAFSGAKKTTSLYKGAYKE